jgi:hypothetical protein
MGKYAGPLPGKARSNPVRSLVWNGTIPGRKPSDPSALKPGRASDAVVGQIQRYMGYVQDALLKPGQSVEGVTIAQEDDLRIRRALSMKNIRFMKYRVDFHLDEAE